jgi:hypothetical protein
MPVTEGMAIRVYRLNLQGKCFGGTCNANSDRQLCTGQAHLIITILYEAKTARAQQN